jgi:hypothetical protein
VGTVKKQTRDAERRPKSHVHHNFPLLTTASQARQRSTVLEPDLNAGCNGSVKKTDS